jgi:hypothetical protein
MHFRVLHHSIRVEMLMVCVLDTSHGVFAEDIDAVLARLLPERRGGA